MYTASERVSALCLTRDIFIRNIFCEIFAFDELTMNFLTNWWWFFFFFFLINNGELRIFCAKLQWHVTHNLEGFIKYFQWCDTSYRIDMNERKSFLNLRRKFAYIRTMFLHQVQYGKKWRFSQDFWEWNLTFEEGRRYFSFRSCSLKYIWKNIERLLEDYFNSEISTTWYILNLMFEFCEYDNTNEFNLIYNILCIYHMM